jgi:hypothetical protein
MNSILSRCYRIAVAITAPILLVLLPLAIPAVPVSAATAPVWGYVWSNNPTSAKYTPYSGTSFNSSSQSVTDGPTIGRNSPGIYTVTFPRMGVTGGVPHVTAFGSGTQQCKVKNWGPVASGSPDLRVLVKCFDISGALADSMFMASFTAQSATTNENVAYLLADRPTTTSYTANPTYSYNSKACSTRSRARALAHIQRASGGLARAVATCK